MEARSYSKKVHSRSTKIYMGIAVFIVLLNLLGCSSASFCDAYIAFVFPVWVNTYGRLMGLFPFSVGEWMIIVGIILLVAAVLSGLISLGCCLSRKKLFGWTKGYLKFFAWIVLFVCLVMTLNCTLLYHASTFEKRYLQGNSEATLEDFVRLRNRVAERCNALSAQMERDEKGYIIYPKGQQAIQAAAKEQMQSLGEQYPQLAGFYPNPKPMFFSDFMCQQDMLGWYFPFSMEANYNQVAYIMNKPASMCHELAHLKGFIYEDEANFIGYLACINSEDPYFEYSGYLSVLGYLEQDLRKAAREEPEAMKTACEGQGLVRLLDAVYADEIFITEEERERIEGEAVLDSETVSQATTQFMDTTLKVNGVSDGVISYSRVVRLLMKYEKESALSETWLKK